MKLIEDIRIEVDPAAPIDSASVSQHVMNLQPHLVSISKIYIYDRIQEVIAKTGVDNQRALGKGMQEFLQTQQLPVPYITFKADATISYGLDFESLKQKEAAKEVEAYAKTI